MCVMMTTTTTTTTTDRALLERLHARLVQSIYPLHESRLSSWREFAGLVDSSRGSTTMTNVPVLGYGRDGTVVYSAENLGTMYPLAESVTIGFCSMRDMLKEVPLPGKDCSKYLNNSVALKDLRNNDRAEEEATVNAFLYNCFAEQSCLQYSIFHPKVCTVRVGNHTLLPMQRFTGTANALLGTCRTRLMLMLAEHVLLGLQVFHKHRLLHLDIKPSNILTLSTQGVGDKFVLADYDIAARADDVIDLISNHRMHGTTGFVSPVMCDDAAKKKKNRLHSRYAKCCFIVDKKCDWNALFDKMRSVIIDEKIDRGVRRSAVFVCDMHSLAVTLYELMGDALLSNSNVAITLLSALLSGTLGNARDALVLIRSLQQSLQHSVEEGES